MADSSHVDSNVITTAVDASGGQIISVVQSNVTESTSVESNVITGGKGSDGIGIPAGGSSGQVLAKNSSSDYDTLWTTPSAGSGAVSSVNSQTGAVTLTQDNVADGTTYKQYSATDKTKLAGIATGATANSSDATLLNRVNHTGTQTASTISDFSTAADARITAAAGSTLATLSAGKIPTSQIPAVALATVQTAASQAAQLALTTQEGDVVVRTDLNQTYMRNAGTAGTMADFTLLNTPTDAVTSVNSQTGTVVLSKTDIGLSNVTNNAQYFPGGTDVAITDGGTGVSTLPTGLLKGAGTSPITAATAGTDYQAPITLTTTGTSGAATFSSNTLNIPNYASGGAPTTATYITQTPDATLSAEQALSTLSTGIVKVTTGTGVLSTAVAGDFPTLNQNTTGTAAGLSANITESQVTNLVADLSAKALDTAVVHNTGAETVAGVKTFSSAPKISATMAEASSNGRALSLDSSGNVIMNDMTAPSEGKVIYDKSYWTALTDFTTFGTAPTLSSGAIRLSMATTTYNLSNQGLELNSPTTPDEMVDFEMTVKVVTLPTTGTGLGLGRQSVQATTGFSMATILDPFTSPNGMTIWPVCQGTVGTATDSKSVSSANVAVGDVVRLTYFQRANTVGLRVDNLTQKTTNSISVTSNLAPVQDFTVPMTSKFRIINISGTYDIQNIRLISRQPQAPKVVCIGDSKTAGYSAVAKDMRWASLLGSLGPVAVLAGAGDRTSDTTAAASYAAALKPKYAILNIGRNDIAGAVATATWQANYASTVTTLKNAGITVIHLLAIPETTNAQTGLNTYINATYASDTRIDVSGSWVNGTHLSSDGTHPSIEGHRLIANTILNNGAIPASANGAQIPTPALPFDPTVYDTIKDVAPPWIAPTLSGTWVNFGAPWSNAGYMKDNQGFVHMQGLVKSGTAGTAIFTLPAGYRPANQIRFPTDAGGAFGAIFITSAGVVTDAGLGSPAVFISLNSIYFKAEA